MRIEFTTRENGPERLVAEAALVFDSRLESGPLVGLKLVGFSIWRGCDTELRVTVPARSFGLSTDRRFFDLVRSTDGTPAPVQALKAWILERFEAQGVS